MEFTSLRVKLVLMTRLFIYIASGLMMVMIGYHLYGANMERKEVKANFDKLSSEFEALNKDNEKINEDIDYYSDPHNLEKALRASSNYRSPNEKLIIVAPQNSD